MTSRLDPDVRAALRAAPKVELHLHLDGAMAAPWLLERVRRRPAAGVRSGWADLAGAEGPSIQSRPIG